MVSGRPHSRARPDPIHDPIHEAADTRALLEIARRHPRPHQVLLLADAGPGQQFLATQSDFYHSLTSIDGKATAYLCENFVCQLPTNDPVRFKSLLTKSAAPAK